MERYNLISVVLPIGYLAIWLLAIFSLTQITQVCAADELQRIEKSEVIRLVVGQVIDIPLPQSDYKNYSVGGLKIIDVTQSSDDKLLIEGKQPGVITLSLSRKDVPTKFEVTNYRIYVYEDQTGMAASPSPLPPPPVGTDPFDISYVHSVYPTAKLKSEMNLADSSILLEILGGDSSRYKGLKELRIKIYQLPNTDFTTLNSVLELYKYNLIYQRWNIRFSNFASESQTMVLSRKEGDKPIEEIFVARAKLPNILIVMRMEGIAGMLPLPDMSFSRSIEEKREKSESASWNPLGEAKNLSIDELRAIIEKGIGEITHYAALAAKYERVGEFSKALEQYDALLKNFPDTSEWYMARAEYGIAKCYEALGKKDDAIKAYKKIIDRYSFNEIEGDYVALAAASTIYLSITTPLSKEFKDFWLSAEINLIDKRNYETALRLYGDLEAPDDAIAAAKFLMIGVCNERLSNIGSEIEALKKSLEKRPSGFAMYLLGAAYQEQRDYEQAISRYARILSGYSDAITGRRQIAEASYRIGKCLEELKRRNEAISSYERFIEKYKDDTEYSYLVKDARIALIGIRKELGQLPFLGVVLLRSENGKVKVAQVIANSPAERVGIKEGDEIVAIDSKPMLSPRMVAEETATRKVGDKVVVTILRDGKKLDVTVELGRMETQENR